MKIRNFLLLFLLTPLVIIAQNEQSPMPLDAAERAEVVDSIGDILERSYVFPEIGKQLQDLLDKNLTEGAYDDITDPIKFSEVLTQDVQSVNGDLHMRVRFDPQFIQDMRSMEMSEEDSLRLVEDRQKWARRENYGFQEVRILDGNIGYLKLDGFSHVTEEAGATAMAAMNLLSNAEALIIDLRENGGGSPSMIQLITSYLYGPEPVHLNNFYHRIEDEITQTWTLPYVPGKRRPDVDVYVLTSQSTFSAAEEFTYNLKNLGRATIIGETTGGGAHPGGTQPATDRFAIWVPNGRAINPISNTNWEGTGVEPDIKVPASEALLEAQIKAIKKMMADAEGPDKAQYEWAMTGLNAELHPVDVSDETLRTYTGNFGERTITYKDGSLYYQRGEGEIHELRPLSEDLFKVGSLTFFRLKILKEDGQVVGLRGYYSNGRTDESRKSN